MAFELDHIFICTSIGAGEADRLITFGLAEGSPNVHQGQGTGCRRFFFHNAHLELLWVENPAETQSNLIRPTYLWERWSGRTGGACPFGLCFRPAGQGVADVPFSASDYRPPYLPESLSLAIATNVNVLTEPMLCYLAFAQRPDSYPTPKRPPLEHAAGLSEITRVELVGPHVRNASPELKAVASAGIVQLRSGTECFVELGFDGESHSKITDFRPNLPLVFGC